MSTDDEALRKFAHDLFAAAEPEDTQDAEPAPRNDLIVPNEGAARNTNSEDKDMRDFAKRLFDQDDF